MLNKENLLKLAAYLDTLPLDYEHFEMDDFLSHGDRTKYSVYALENGGVATTCGAVACAIGHGPSAGFLFQPDELTPDETPVGSEWVPILKPDWHRYSARVFASSGDDADEWDFMFGGVWSSHDNTPIGAAARIRYTVENYGRVDFSELYYARDPEDYVEYIKPESLEYWKEEVL